MPIVIPKQRPPTPPRNLSVVDAIMITRAFGDYSLTYAKDLIEANFPDYFRLGGIEPKDLGRFLKELNAAIKEGQVP